MHDTCANTADVQRFFGEMQGFWLMLMVLLVSSVPQSAHSTVALKRAPSPPAFRATSPTPFTSPRYHGWILWPAGPIFGPTQRKWTHSSLRHLIMPLCDWWSSWWTLSVRPCCPAPALMCFHPALSNKQNKSHVDDPSHSRPVNDRKRKFVDSELALDTEGNADAEIGDIVTSSAVYFRSISCR